MVMPSAPTPLLRSHYDVVILGGAFSGSSMALLLKRARPEISILIIEKSEEFDRKVGESTSEVAGCFLTRVLGLSNHLSCHHFQKHGLRMWFSQPGNDCPNACSEIGPWSQARLATFQLDRSKLDQHMLELAVAEGCDLLRPASVKSVELLGAGKNVVSLKHAGETITISASWVSDCSGKAALLARQRGTWRRLEEHPVHSMWVRFSNVRCLDTHEARQMMPSLQEGTFVARGSATNHLMGHGWWSWIIPLSNGDFSAGVTWDERLFSPPGEGPIGQRVLQHLLTHPIGKLMFEHAKPVENDARIYKNLPYYSTEVCGDGWIISGDAAGFMDPLYSQGLDYCAHSTYSAHKMILAGLDGMVTPCKLKMYNELFHDSYHRWFNGIYRNKYQYLGDADLMHAAFLLDIAAYFVGPVRLVYHWTDREFSKMPYNGNIGAAFGSFMAFYNRRLERIARVRLAKGEYGKNNLGQRYFIRIPFEASPKAFGHLFRGVKTWLKLEWECLFTRPLPPMEMTSKEKETRKMPATATAATVVS
jgi:flavin-dependent dehydrogenase